MNAKTKVSEILKIANIYVNGDNSPDLQVYDERFYNRVLSNGTLGFGESYMDGWWSTNDLPELTRRLVFAELSKKITRINFLPYILKSKITNMQSVKRAFEVGKKHYDTGNDLFEKMLDTRMVYTCGFWRNASTLDEAQEAKLDLVCKKINLQKGDKVLDIGCGFGSFAKFAAERYGAEVVGITISKEQFKFAQENTKGLPVEIRLQDYRNLSETFDKIVSIGMFEHVGIRNYREYMTQVNRSLKDGGLFLLHTIGNNESVTITDPWINKYIFPNGMIPSIQQIGKSIEGLFVMEDWHNFGADYEKTLMQWFSNFDVAWTELKGNYDERFYRMWKYYLLTCAGGFRSRHIQLWQIVLSKKGISGGYVRIQ